MQEKIILFDSKDNKIEGEIVAIFKNGDINYVAYTTSSSDGELNLLVSKFNKVDEIYRIFPIEDEKEWAFVEEYLNKEVFGGDEDYE